MDGYRDETVGNSDFALSWTGRACSVAVVFVDADFADC